MAGTTSATAVRAPRTWPASWAWGRAVELTRRSLADESARLAALRDRLERGILEQVEEAAVNGDPARRVPNTSSICFDYVEGEALVIALDLKGVACSTGAACSSGAIEPSHVLTAIGLRSEQARASLRFSLGRQNTEAQVDQLLEILPPVVAHLRDLSPAYKAPAYKAPAVQEELEMKPTVAVGHEWRGG